MFYPQGNFYSQGNLGYPQGGFGFQGGPQATPNAIPFANTLYGYPQPTPHFAQGFAQSPQVPNWQQLAHQLAALQQQAVQHPPALQHQAGLSGINGIANGIGQPVGVWQQPQTNPEQITPLLQQQLQQQPQHQLQRLAQYHYLVAQQFAQLAAQQAAQTSGNPYAGQFIPGTGQFAPNQLGANFVPGITMH